MNWREQMHEGMDLMGASIELMAVGRYEDAFRVGREANRLQAEALEWRWTHDPPKPFVVMADGEPGWLEPPRLPPELT